MSSNETMTYAAPLRRIAAFLIDLYWLLPRLILGFFVTSPLALLAGENPSDEEAAALGMAMMLILWGIVVFSFARWESSPRHASPGKSFMGFTVTDQAGGGVSLRRALVRNALKFLIWPLFVLVVVSKRQQAPHDLVTGVVMPRLGAAAEARRNAFLLYWIEETPKVMVPIFFGIITIPILVGFLILLVWLPRWWSYRKTSRRMLLGITEAGVEDAVNIVAVPAV